MFFPSESFWYSNVLNNQVDLLDSLVKILFAKSGFPSQELNYVNYKFDILPVVSNPTVALKIHCQKLSLQNETLRVCTKNGNT